MDPRDLLVANLEVVDRAIAYACRRHRLEAQEAEDFASTAKLKLLENDYAILRKFQERSSFATFIAVVVQRQLLDYRVHLWGKWHPSAEAKRLGDPAADLERMIVRDGQTIEHAFSILHARDRTVTLEALRQIASQLPPRPPKRKTVDLDEAAALPGGTTDPFRGDREQASARASAIIRAFIDELPPDDRLILQLRFDSAMTVAQIARSLHLDQKQLYRRIEHRLREVRSQLERAGIGADEAASLIRDRGVILDFDLGKPATGPSMDQETITPEKEEASQ